MKVFFKDVLESCNPWKYDELSKKTTKETTKLFLKVLFLASVIFLIASLQKVSDVQTGIGVEIQNIRSLVKQTNATGFEFPKSSPIIVYSAKSEPTGRETVFVNDRAVWYKFFGKNYERDRSELEGAIPVLSSGILLFILPSILFYAYLFLAIKYLLFALVLATLYFLILDITPYALRWKQMFVVTVHALTLMMLLEAVGEFYPKVLLPLGSIAGMDFYAATIFLFVALVTAGLMKIKREKEAE